MTVARGDPPPGRQPRLGVATALALLLVGAPAAAPASVFLDRTDQDPPHRLFLPAGLGRRNSTAQPAV